MADSGLRVELRGADARLGEVRASDVARLIPVQHGQDAHRAIPNSRLEIFPKAGHFPHLDEPRRFAGLLVDFVGQTEDRLVQTAVPPSTDGRVPALAAT